MNSHGKVEFAMAQKLGCIKIKRVVCAYVRVCMYVYVRVRVHVCPQALIAILKEYGVPQGLADLIQELHESGAMQVRADGSVSLTSFKVKSGVRQGCVLSPLLFNCFWTRCRGKQWPGWGEVCILTTPLVVDSF